MGTIDFCGIRITVDKRSIRAWKAAEKVITRWGYALHQNQTGAYNCLGGGTKVITRDGWRPLAELAGTDVELLTIEPGHGGPGRWVTAPVRSFGEQDVFKITLARYGVERTVIATGDHRWYVHDAKGGTYEVVTEELEPRGHRLTSVRPQSVATRTSPSPVGVMMGVVFGDGTIAGNESVAYLCGDKDRALERYFPSDQRRTRDETRVRISGLPQSWKDRAPHGEGTSVMYGWLAGYFAADGRVSKQSVCEINSADLWRLESAKEVALTLGISSGPITSVKRTGYGDEPTLLYSLRLDPRTLDSDFFLVPAHRERWNGTPRKRPPDWSVIAVEPAGQQEVFCAVVKGTECFAIEDFILTGNCRHIGNDPKRPWSAHAWGIALDINWKQNPDGSRLVTNMPKGMVDDLEALTCFNGQPLLRWGGDWDRDERTSHSYYDAMHFELISTPEEISQGVIVDPNEEEEMITNPEDVRYWQNRLRRLSQVMNTPSYDPKGVDGVIGNNTRKALEAWQVDRGIAVDGTLNRTTCDSITTAVVIHIHLAGHLAAEHIE